MVSLLAFAVVPFTVQAFAATRQLNQCQNTNNGATDSDGDDCSMYSEHPSFCSAGWLTDDSDFKAKEMCCSCGGGLSGTGSGPSAPLTTPFPSASTSAPTSAPACPAAVDVELDGLVTTAEGKAEPLEGTYTQDTSSSLLFPLVYKKGSYVLYRCFGGDWYGQWMLGSAGAEESSSSCSGYFKAVGSVAKCPHTVTSWLKVSKWVTGQWVSSSLTVSAKSPEDLAPVDSASPGSVVAVIFVMSLCCCCCVFRRRLRDCFSHSSPAGPTQPDLEAGRAQPEAQQIPAGSTLLILPESSPKPEPMNVHAAKTTSSSKKTNVADIRNPSQVKTTAKKDEAAEAKDMAARKKARAELKKMTTAAKKKASAELKKLAEAEEEENNEDEAEPQDEEQEAQANDAEEEDVVEEPEDEDVESEEAGDEEAEEEEETEEDELDEEEDA